jgi:hypothetical protein
MFRIKKKRNNQCFTKKSRILTLFALLLITLTMILYLSNEKSKLSINYANYLINFKF